MAVVAFRVDASPRIGLGHLSRCLALAEALEARGARCEFVCAEMDDASAARVESAGHRLHQLENPPGQDASESADHASALDCLGIVPNWFVVDHYGLSAAWESAARRSGARVLAIDDLPRRPHDCDLLLDHNAGRRPADYDGLVPAAARRLAGPKFALIGSGFRRARAGSLSRRECPAVRTVLVSLGGSQSPDVQRRVFDALAACDPALDADIVVASAVPIDADAVLPASIASHCQVVVGAGDLASIATSADLAIGAAGVSALERCVVGLPTLCLTMADNQQPGALALAREGAHWYLGDVASESFATRFQAALAHARTDGIALALMARMAAGLCDGLGAGRVADSMLAPSVRMRLALPSDAERVHAWRNDPRVRERSFDTGAIPLVAHREWFSQALASPARRMLVGELDGTPVGFARFDLEAGDCEISVFLDPERIGSGLGPPLIDAACRWVAGIGVHRVVARVREDNPGSRAAFERAGFTGESVVLVRQVTGAMD
jgi:UDP-2,4-diacetamido-2,4,6-trideoxy-beta-L-altropyranose hydrolase